MLALTLSRPARHVLAVVTIALVVLILKGAWIFSTPVRSLGSTTWIIDDAFIEIQVGRNIATGKGFTYDGVHPTSGSPLLWSYMLAAPHAVSQKDFAIQTDFALSAIFGVLAAVVVFFLARRVTGRIAVAWTAFLLALLSGNAFLSGMNGMDTAFFTFTGLMAFAAALSVGKPARCPPWAWGAFTGLWAGLSLMTRADGLFLLIPLTLMHGIALARSWRRTEWREERDRLTGLLAVAGLCAALTIGWHLVHTGAPFPANQAGRRELALALHGFTFEQFNLHQYLFIVGWNVFQLLHLFDIATGSSLLCIVALLAGLLIPGTRRLALLAAGYMVPFLGTLIVYQWYFPDLHGLRYINLGVHLLFILIATLLWNLPQYRWRTIGIGSMTACILVLSWYLHYQMNSRFPWAKFMSYVGRPTVEQNERSWRVTEWIRDHVPAGAVIGVRDHGKIALFSGHPIQDLAGNIDPVVPVRVRRHTLRDYLRQQGVQYLVIPSGRSDLLYKELERSLVVTPAAGYPGFEEAAVVRIDWNASPPL